MTPFIVGAWRLLTSKLAGPIATALCLLLAMVALSQCTAKQSERRRADGAEKTLLATQHSLDTCHSNVEGLEASLKRLNDAVASAYAEGVRRTEAAAQGLAAALKGKADVEARVAKLLRQPPAGIDACARMESADARVLEVLQ